MRSAAITQAEDWTAGSCTTSTANTTAPEPKPFVFGVIPEFVDPKESVTLSCSDAPMLVSVFNGIVQTIEVCLVGLV